MSKSHIPCFPVFINLQLFDENGCGMKESELLLLIPVIYWENNEIGYWAVSVYHRWYLKTSHESGENSFRCLYLNTAPCYSCMSLYDPHFVDELTKLLTDFVTKKIHMFGDLVSHIERSDTWWTWCRLITMKGGIYWEWNHSLMHV